MTQFTKGPWELFLTGDERGIYIGLDLFGLSSKVVTTVDCDDLPKAEAQANAHLIAAAPELYEALKGASELINRILKGDDWGAIEEYYIEAMDALAKARGEA